MKTFPYSKVSYNCQEGKYKNTKNLPAQGFSRQDNASMSSASSSSTERDRSYAPSFTSSGLGSGCKTLQIAAKKADQKFERRKSGKRARRRDQLFTPLLRQHSKHQKSQRHENLYLLMDDDVREAALSLVRIEQFLLETQRLLKSVDKRQQVHALFADSQIGLEVDHLSETIAILGNRLDTLLTSP